MVTAARKVLDGAGIKVARYLTGSYVTSLEMAGCSITVTAVDAARWRCGTRRCTRRRCAGASERVPGGRRPAAPASDGSAAEAMVRRLPQVMSGRRNVRPGAIRRNKSALRTTNPGTT